MSRAIFIGGFGNGRHNAERVASALEEHYEEVDPFTFSEGMANPDTIRRAAKGADAFTLSAGMMALVGAAPNHIDAFGPPLPTSKRHLVWKTAVKTARMHTPGIGIRQPEDILAVGEYDLSAGAELLVHPWANLQHLGYIARFHAVHEALHARSSGIPIALNYTLGDEYFQPTDRHHELARVRDIPIVRQPGVHDELVLRPAQTLQLHLENPNNNS